jgi:hypothetical protein
MAPVNKAKASGVSATSFLDLKAELSKQEAEFSNNKAKGKSRYIVGGVKRADKVPSLFVNPHKASNFKSIEIYCVDTGKQRCLVSHSSGYRIGSHQ